MFLTWGRVELPHNGCAQKKTVKVRLVAKDARSIRPDQPTCSKEGFRIALAVIASKDWSSNSLDIEIAFLQGMKMEQSIY